MMITFLIVVVWLLMGVFASILDLWFWRRLFNITGPFFSDPELYDFHWLLFGLEIILGPTALVGVLLWIYSNRNEVK